MYNCLQGWPLTLLTFPPELKIMYESAWLMKKLAPLLKYYSIVLHHEDFFMNRHISVQSFHSYRSSWPKISIELHLWGFVRKKKLGSLQFAALPSVLLSLPFAPLPLPLSSSPHPSPIRSPSVCKLPLRFSGHRLFSSCQRAPHLCNKLFFNVLLSQ